MSKKIVYLLKEIELISLASKRRYLIEKNSNTKELAIDHDSLNYPYRKYIFKQMRNQFFELKKLNKNILSLISNIDSNNFIFFRSMY